MNIAQIVFAYACIDAGARRAARWGVGIDLQTVLPLVAIADAIFALKLNGTHFAGFAQAAFEAIGVIFAQAAFIAAGAQEVGHAGAIGV